MRKLPPVGYSTAAPDGLRHLEGSGCGGQRGVHPARARSLHQRSGAHPAESAATRQQVDAPNAVIRWLASHAPDSEMDQLVDALTDGPRQLRALAKREASGAYSMRPLAPLSETALSAHGCPAARPVSRRRASVAQTCRTVRCSTARSGGPLPLPPRCWRSPKRPSTHTGPSRLGAQRLSAAGRRMPARRPVGVRLLLPGPLGRRGGRSPGGAGSGRGWSGAHRCGPRGRSGRC